MRIMLPALLLATASVTAQAQTANPGQDTNSPRSNGIAAQTAPGVAAANGAVAGQVGAQADLSAEDQTRYAQDVQAYETARRSRRRKIRHDQAYYNHQQRAYAQAMADWRVQAAACERGDHRACNAPTPRPGDYM